MPEERLIIIDDLVKIYPMGETEIVAIDHVSLDLETGEFAGIVGPSGSGKTTLLNIVGTLDAPTSGSVVVLGRRVETLDHRQAADLRNRKVGFIFQTFNLLPVYTVFENVEFPLLLLGMSGDERKKLVDQALGAGERGGEQAGAGDVELHGRLASASVRRGSQALGR